MVFAHGSGSSRHSPRNRYVAAVLNQAGLGTLLLDLLTPDEEADRANVFDIGLLAGRLAACHRLAARPARRPQACRSATSVPAPAPPRRCGPPLNPARDDRGRGVPRRAP